MNPRLILIALCGLLSSLSAQEQMVISGSITDNESKEPMPYVNIGIRNKNQGTCSLADGSFTLRLPASCSNDSLTFSMIGYTEHSISLRTCSNGEPLKITLAKKQYELGEAIISAKKLQEKKYGIKKYNPVFHFIDAMPDRTDIFEIAQLVHLEKSYSKITSLRLFLNETKGDSGIFRINFYNYNGTQPTTRCAEKEIRQTKKVKDGWLIFDLSEEQLYLKGDVVAAIEFIPGKTAISYDVKLGGKTKSFLREHSLGVWQTPPHHYRMYLTALTDADKKSETDTDENEAAPACRMYSDVVNDSFSIYVHLPAGYDPSTQTRYPVIYLTDGNAYFDLLSDMYKSKQWILVGIGYKNAFEADILRDRDYSWPQTPRFPGGADRFLTFIRNRLVPFIDSAYTTDPTQRTLMGHSLGGYFTLYALKKDLQDPVPTFTKYISASPSLEYANGYLAGIFKTLEEKNDVKKTLYLSMGSKETCDPFGPFVELMGSGRFKNLELKTTIIDKADHMGAALPAFKKALND